MRADPVDVHLRGCAQLLRRKQDALRSGNTPPRGSSVSAEPREFRSSARLKYGESGSPCHFASKLERPISAQFWKLKP